MRVTVKLLIFFKEIKDSLLDNKIIKSWLYKAKYPQKNIFSVTTLSSEKTEEPGSTINIYHLTSTNTIYKFIIYICTQTDQA